MWPLLLDTHGHLEPHPDTGNEITWLCWALACSVWEHLLHSHSSSPSVGQVLPSQRRGITTLGPGLGQKSDCVQTLLSRSRGCKPKQSVPVTDSSCQNYAFTGPTVKCRAGEETARKVRSLLVKPSESSTTADPGIKCFIWDFTINTKSAFQCLFFFLTVNKFVLIPPSPMHDCCLLI